jgi:hypothetical protein
MAGSVVKVGIDFFKDCVDLIFPPTNEEGIKVEFNTKDLMTLSEINTAINSIVQINSPGLTNEIMYKYVMHAQEVLEGNTSKTIDTSHAYRTIYATDKSYYARTLDETDYQYFTYTDEKEKEELIEKYYKQYPSLKINEKDSEEEKKEKEKILKQIPHSYKITNEFFKRKEKGWFTDKNTNFLLGCFAQW